MSGDVERAGVDPSIAWICLADHSRQEVYVVAVGRSRYTVPWPRVDILDDGTVSSLTTGHSSGVIKIKCLSADTTRADPVCVCIYIYIYIYIVNFQGSLKCDLMDQYVPGITQLWYTLLHCIQQVTQRSAYLLIYLMSQYTLFEPYEDTIQTVCIDNKMSRPMTAPTDINV